MQESLGILRESAQVLSGALIPLASLVYAWGVIRKEISPTKATWVVWTALSGLTALSMFFEGALNYQIAIVAFADVIVLGLALWYGDAWSWTKVDVTCLVGAAVSLLLWWVTDSALWAIILLLGATVIGFVPMATNLWKRPEAEKPLAWIVMCVSSMLLLFSLETWTIASAAQPVVYLAVPVIILVLITRRRPAVA